MIEINKKANSLEDMFGLNIDEIEALSIDDMKNMDSQEKRKLVLMSLTSVIMSFHQSAVAAIMLFITILTGVNFNNFDDFIEYLDRAITNDEDLEILTMKLHQISEMAIKKKK